MDTIGEISVKTLFFSFFLVFLIVACSSKQHATLQHKPYWAQPVQEIQLENFHQVDQKIYRSAQPSQKDFQKLEAFGIDNIVNLRQWHDDKEKLQNTHLIYYHLPLNASKVTYEDLLHAVLILKKAKGKTVVHCLHGSDRTGVVIAAYRIGVQGWSKEKAIDEFVHGGYGFHSFWFANLPKLLQNIDEKQFRKDLEAIYEQQN